MTPLHLVRPARHDDLSDLLAVAQSAGTGMTTVPQTEDAIGHRIAASERAFGAHGPATAADIFFFVLEIDGRAAGMASIFPDLGADRPFYSYKLSHIAAQAPESGLCASTDILHLCNDFHGYAEIGTLLVGDAARGTGAGRFLSLSRLFFMGRERARFGHDVMAEIRGHFDASGNSPFWEHIAAKFFQLSFEEADRLSAHDFRFISHLMPKFPIYVPLLPEAAQATIGRPHETSGRALALLENEGFRWTKYVDIFDGGPSVECPVDRIRTVRQTQSMQVAIAPEAIGATTTPLIIAACDWSEKGFEAVRGVTGPEPGLARLTPAAADRLGIQSGDEVVAAPLKGE